MSSQVVPTKTASATTQGGYVLPPELHLCIGIAVQSSKKDLIANSRVALDMEDLCQSSLPGWIALQLDAWSEKHQKIRLTHHALGNLGVNQIL